MRTTRDARLELAVALHVCRDGRSWTTTSRATGICEDVLMSMEGVWESRRKIMLPMVVQLARGFGVAVEDLLPGTALRSGPVHPFRWSSALQSRVLSRHVQRRLAESGVDLYALFKAENNTIRRRFNRLVEEKPDVFWLSLAAVRCGTTLAEWLPAEWRRASEPSPGEGRCWHRGRSSSWENGAHTRE